MKAFEATIIFPHQLFKEHPAITPNRLIYLIEESLFFSQYQFHKQKLVLHRASMKSYQHWLEKIGYQVIYIESINEQSDIRLLIEGLSAAHLKVIHIADVVDNWLSVRIKSQCILQGIELRQYETPNFLNTLGLSEKMLTNKNHYHQTDFYIKQRKYHQILIDDAGQPVGGKWTYDADNRERFPKKTVVPPLPCIPENEFLEEARNYVQTYFSSNPGQLYSNPLYAVNFEDAENWLRDFLLNRFEHFGKYEDAIVSKESVLHHSVLSPLLNIGLLHPGQILEQALSVANQNGIPLNSVEGFIRQLIGWREFIRTVYETKGSRQRTTNFWNFSRKIPRSFWTATTGIIPIDLTIKKILTYGYCHHIERLMVLGNFMVLCEFDPDEVYRWFMEMFIDAFDWVMVPNVYGMTQFADGGLMSTKPYISSSNYLMKLSDYEKGDWQQIWDGLFWRFMHTHRTFFLQNPRLGMLISTLDKMSVEKKQQHLDVAEHYLNAIDSMFVSNII